MIDFRWASVDERTVIQLFLHSRMGRIPFERWPNILDCRWNREDDHFGVVATDGRKLVGFLGVVFAEREIRFGRHRTGNLTSWFVEKRLRGHGIGRQMLTLATSAIGTTYTALTANDSSGALLVKNGWDVMETRRFLWRYISMNKRAVAHVLSVNEADRLGGMVARRLLEDHDGLSVTPFALETNSGDICFVVLDTTRRTSAAGNYEVLHVSNRELFSERIRDFVNALAQFGMATLSGDSRFFLSNAVPDETIALKHPRYFRSADLAPQDVDSMYSETVLLGLAS
jgi:hypothetical protein